MYYKFKTHSIIDVITNSSTEIFTFQDRSLPVLEEMVNEFIKAISPRSKAKFSDLFNAIVLPDDDGDRIYDILLEYSNDSYGNYEMSMTKEVAKEYTDNFDEYLSGLISGKYPFEKEYEKILKDYERYGGNALYIAAKESKYEKLAKTILSFLNSSDARECYC